MRLDLINYRGHTLTRDTAEAITAMEKRLAESGWQVLILGPVPGSEKGNPLSLVPSGREVHLSLEREGTRDEQAILNALWGHAVPLGFTPATRYPTPGPGDTVFHYYGPWRPLMDRLFSEGRGHLVWPSLCAASLVDVGRWEGKKGNERFIQAQLHRTGHNCGPVDGDVGPRTARAIESLGMVRADLMAVYNHLKELQDVAPTQQERRTGSVQLPGQKFNIGATGGIKVTRTNTGAALVIEGPGRLVIDVGE
jgi:hypothetical protein